MDIIAPFGFVTGCHAGDKFMVGATLASIQHYCPGVPICLTVDGDVDVSDLEREYAIITLRISELPSPEMRKTLGGSFHAKQAAMWEGPFERYVWLDSDAIVWGDITAKIRHDVDFQIFWNGVSIPSASDLEAIPEWLPHFYFDPTKLRKHDAKFDWRGHAYFSAGVYATRRNSIDYHYYCMVRKIADTESGLFAWGDMGMLNYIVHSQTQLGKMRVAISDLQNIPDYNGREEFENDCAGGGWHFPEKIRSPRIGHFCGRKPFLSDIKAYSKPFTIARLEHYRKTRGALGAWAAVLNEERKILQKKIFAKAASAFAGSRSHRDYTT